MVIFQPGEGYYIRDLLLNINTGMGNIGSYIIMLVVNMEMVRKR